MPYAKDGLISKNPIEGGIEITTTEYTKALEGMCYGEAVSVCDGKLKMLSAEYRTVYADDGTSLQVRENDDTPEGYSDTAPVLPTPEPQPDRFELLLEALIAKGVIDEKTANELI